MESYYLDSIIFLVKNHSQNVALINKRHGCFLTKSGLSDPFWLFDCTFNLSPGNFPTILLQDLGFCQSMFSKDNFHLLQVQVKRHFAAPVEDADIVAQTAAAAIEIGHPVFD